MRNWIIVTSMGKFNFSFYTIFLYHFASSYLLRILWFNWRDIRNPSAGGAEVFTHEVMRRLVKKGYDMTLFTAQFDRNIQNEQVDGVNIIRDGGIYTVYNKARKYYNKYKDNYDLVVDEINAKPFFTPKFVKEKPIVALFHQIMGELWFHESRFPINYMGYYYFEKKWLSYYRNVPVITVSDSSRKDLQAIGLTKIYLVSEGLNVAPLSEVRQEKEPKPTIVFFGRLKKHKAPHHALEAFSIIKKEIPDAQMWVIGDGYMLKELEDKFNFKDVTFYGYVEDEVKNALLSKAHLILVPSSREGWGLVVTEANAMGTPAIGYNVPGLRDSIRDGETGILVKENSPYNLAFAATSLLKDPTRLYKLSSNALLFSRQFSWDNTANEFDRIIKSAIGISVINNVA
jgi:glycosyltransferase involved in cell wall biosynthesis